MANRAVIGKRTTPTTISDGTTTVNVLQVEYDYIHSGGYYRIKAVLRLANAVSFNSSANLTLTMPDGTTYVEDDWTYQGTGSYQTYYGSSPQPPGGVSAPLVRLNDYGETAYSNTPIVIGAEGGRGAFVSGINTSSGSGTSASPYAGANVIGVDEGRLESTTFDSGGHIGGGLSVYEVHQGILQTSNTSYWNGNRGHTGVNITHNWGRNHDVLTSTRVPAYALRFSRGSYGNQYLAEAHRSMAMRPRVKQVYGGRDYVLEVTTSHSFGQYAQFTDPGIYGGSSENYYNVEKDNWIQVDIKLGFDLQNQNANSTGAVGVQDNGYYVRVDTPQTIPASYNNTSTVNNFEWSRQGSTQGDIVSFRAKMGLNFTPGANSGGRSDFKFVVTFKNTSGTIYGVDVVGGVWYGPFIPSLLTGQNSKTTPDAIVAYTPWKEESKMINAYTYNSETVKHYQVAANTAASNNNVISIEAINKTYSKQNNAFGGYTETTIGYDENIYYALIIFHEENFKDGESL